MGSRFGLPLAGIAGGFISAIATIGAMATRAARDPRLARGCAVGAVLSNIATVLQLAAVLLVTNRATARAVIVPLSLAGVAALGYGALFLFGLRLSDDSFTAEAWGRAFSLRTAFLFAATLLSVLFVSAAITRRMGMRGLVLAAGLAGFADTHSPAIGVASLVNAGKIAPADTVMPILTALTTNSITKAAFAVVLGRRDFFLRVLTGLILMVLAAWAGFLFL